MTIDLENFCQKKFNFRILESKYIEKKVEVEAKCRNNSSKVYNSAVLTSDCNDPRIQGRVKEYGVSDSMIAHPPAAYLAFTIDLDDPFFEPFAKYFENKKIADVLTTTQSTRFDFEEIFEYEHHFPDFKYNRYPKFQLVEDASNGHILTFQCDCFIQCNYNDEALKLRDDVLEANKEYYCDYNNSTIKTVIENHGKQIAQDYLEKNGLMLEYTIIVEEAFKKVCQDLGLSEEEYKAKANDMEESLKMCVSLEPKLRVFGIKNINRFIQEKEFIRDEDLEWTQNAMTVFPELQELVDHIYTQRKIMDAQGEIDHLKGYRWKQARKHDALEESVKEDVAIKSARAILDKQIGEDKRQKKTNFPDIPGFVKPQIETPSSLKLL